ncbi:hypothetical protein ACEWY4_002268 [Coilia grayii]|uniref:Sushi domain-containing protein n=1 Tax=Coilia grayii TaxID=363190 RepID=A0ABD1KVB4_9TELE
MQRPSGICLSCVSLLPPRSGSFSVERGTGVSVGSVLAFWCRQGFQLVGNERITCLLRSGAPHWSNYQPVCEAIPTPEDRGLRVAVLVSVVSGIVIVTMSLSFILCCLQERLAKHRGHRDTHGSSRRRSRLCGSSRHSDCWLEREDSEWEAFPPPKVFHLSPRYEPHYPHSSPVYLGGLAGYDNRAYHRSQESLLKAPMAGLYRADGQIVYPHMVLQRVPTPTAPPPSAPLAPTAPLYLHLQPPTNDEPASAPFHKPSYSSPNSTPQRLFRGEAEEGNETVGNSSVCQHTDDVVCKLEQCRTDATSTVWVVLYCLVLAKGLVCNATLLVLLCRRGKNPTSQVLGINVAIINIIFLCALPAEIYVNLHKASVVVQRVSEVFVTLNVFSSPLLLASMCVERYVAVAFPVLYLRLSSREYGGWVALVWGLTVIVAGVVSHLGLRPLLPALASLVVILFLVMLASLLGIIRALCHRSPAQAKADLSPIKRKALVNVLAVMVPAVLTYVPATVMLALMKLTSVSCGLYLSMVGCLKFGVFIGPMFYLSRAKQFSCFKRG